jgi:DNA (cytosine-5)-methyltransferase 1
VVVRPRKPKAVDLFCGCGGFSLGAHEAGFDVVRAYDNNPILTSSFERNFPNTKLRPKDISRLTGAEIEKDVGKIDLVFGGPPCQGFSAIGRRDKNDDRRKLLGHFFRLVAELKPAAFVMENVKGLGFADARHELVDALELVPDDYVISDPMVLDAANFGAATRRERIFVVGYDPDRCEAIDFANLLNRRDTPATVRDAIADLSAAKRVEQEADDLWELPHDTDITEYAKALRSEDRRFTGNRRTAHTQNVVKRFSKVPQGGMDDVGKHPRLKWHGQCPTLRAGTGADMGSYQSVRPIHPEENRVITVREAARLQGFPDDHLFHPTIWHSFRMIGNSVSPIMAEAVFRAIRAKLPSTQPRDVFFAEAAE